MNVFLFILSIIGGDNIIRKIFLFLVVIFLVLISISPAIISYNLIDSNENNSKNISKKNNFDFNEFRKYLRKNKQKQSYYYNSIYKRDYSNETIYDPKITNYSSNEIIVVFKDFINVNELEKINVEGIWYDIEDRIPQLHAALLKINRIDAIGFIEKIERKNYIECAEINHLRFLNYVPNDPYWNESWGHKKINCDKAWDLPSKMKYAWLTILDTGIDADHEDLKSANVYQWDFIENDGTADDDTGTGHGTNITGIALARINNSIGIAGIAGNSPHIEVLKIFDKFKVTTTWIIIKAIIYSIVAHFPNYPSIICMCFGNKDYSFIEQSLFDTLRFGNMGILFIAAVGNSGCSNRIDFPAGYNSVIAVGAINESGILCRYPGNWGSNYNKNKREVDIVAPGIDIITTTDSDILGKKYGYFSGTSAATAYISGVAALWYGARATIKGYKNRKNEPDKCEKALFSNAQSVGDKDPYKYGHGLVNAYETIPKVKSNTEKSKINILKYFLLNFPLFNKISKNILIKVLSTNDFLNGLVINNYIYKEKKNLEYNREERT